MIIPFTLYIMKTILFATTNKEKIKEAQEILGIHIEGIGLDIAETQSLEPKKVAVNKALAYFQKLQQPLFVEDVSLTFNSLNGLPGPYIDGFFTALGNEGLIKILSPFKDKSATAQTTLTYVDQDQEPISFVGQVEGTISQQPLGENGFGWDPIFIPNGHIKTFAQMTKEEKNSFSMRRLALIQMQKYLK